MNAKFKRGNRRVGLIALTMALALVDLTPRAQAQEKRPFTGNWNANLSKSRLHENHQFKSAKIKFYISDKVVSLTFTGVTMAGKQESGTKEVYPDGKEYPVEEAPGVVVIAKWESSRVLKVLAKKDRSVISESTYEVSSDDKTLTATIKGIDGKGRPFEQIIVFDRE
jgi:hypothetical protein